MNQALVAGEGAQSAAPARRKGLPRRSAPAHRGGHERGSAIDVLPTGGGRLLCFHLASLFLPQTVLVGSPLISLMQEQENKLKAALAILLDRLENRPVQVYFLRGK